jgi:hypothetical protein
MRGRSAVLGFLALVAGQGAAQPPASPPAQVAPAPRWHVDGSGDRCILTRPLDASTTLILRTFPLSGDYELMLARQDWPGSAARIADGAAVTLLPESKSYDRRGALLPLGGGVGKALAFGALPPDFLSGFGTARTLAVTSGGKAIAELAVPPAARAATEALRRCEAVKAVDWGADPAAFEQGGTLPKPIGDPRKWLDERDLGSANTWHDFGAGAVFRLVLGADARVERCDVLEASPNSGLRANGCKSLIAHARYEPAKDAQGRPVRSAFAYSTGFQVKITFEIR